MTLYWGTYSVPLNRNIWGCDQPRPIKLVYEILCNMFFFFYFQCLSSWGYFSATIIPNIVIPTDQDVLKDKCVTGDNFIWGDWCCDLVLYKYNWTGLKLLYCKWECVDTLQLLKVCPTNLPCTRLQMLDYVCIKRKKHFFPVYFNMVLLHPH